MQFQLKPLEPALGCVLPQGCSDQLPFKVSFGTPALSQQCHCQMSPWCSMLWCGWGTWDLTSAAVWVFSTASMCVCYGVSHCLVVSMDLSLSLHSVSASLLPVGPMCVLDLGPAFPTMLNMVGRAAALDFC